LSFVEVWGRAEEKSVRCPAAKEVGMGNPAEKNDRSPDNHILGDHPPSVARYFFQKNETSFLELGKIGFAHQVTITFPGRAPAFVKSPYDKALATAAIPGRKYALDICGVLFEFSLDVCPRVTLHI